MLIAAMAFMAISSSPTLAGQTALYYNSSPGDWIGQGQEVLLTTDDVDFYPRINYDNGVGFWINNFAQNPWPNYIWWSLNFAAPYNARIVEGLYENAARFPFQNADQPGLDLSGSGRGCNRLSGEFEVLEAVYDPDTGNIVSFAADFVQYCETWMPPLYGSIRYNSDVPLPTMMPPTITLVSALNSAQCVEATGPDGATVQLTGSARTDNPVQLTWSTSSGDTGFGPDFSFLLGVDQATTVTLIAEDLTSGDTASNTLDVCVSDTTPPQVTILSPVQGSTFVGENATLTVQVSDIVDKNIVSYRRFVGEVGAISLDPDSGSSSTMLYRKVDGEPEIVTITAEAVDASGNTGSAQIVVYQLHDYGIN